MYGEKHMLGFVSALSSALALIVLIASVLLANLLTVSIKKKDKAYDIKLVGQLTKKDFPNEKSIGEYKRVGGKEIMISKNILSSKSFPVEPSSYTKISTGCSYGNNFNYDVASKLSSLNYLILKKKYFNGNISVIMEKPHYINAGINDCWVKTESDNVSK